MFNNLQTNTATPCEIKSLLSIYAIYSAVVSVHSTERGRDTSLCNSIPLLGFIYDTYIREYVQDITLNANKKNC